MCYVCVLRVLRVFHFGVVLGSFGVISGYFGSLWGYFGLFWVILGHLGTFPDIWGDYTLLGIFWGLDQTGFGHFWQFWQF
jgi:hypothetical protein